MKASRRCLVVLVISATVLLYQLRQMHSIYDEQNAIVAAYNQEHSADGIASSFATAFFDGLTQGQFADEGIFSEAKRLNRMENTVARKITELSAAYNHARSFRNVAATFLVLSLLAMIICLIAENQAPPISRVPEVPRPPQDPKHDQNLPPPSAV